jgi:hypothetical protein
MAILATDQTPWKIITLKYCTVSFYRHWVWTQFPDGQGYGAFPEYEPDRPFFPNYSEGYRAAAKFAGYTDPMVYCLVHDFSHSYIAERVLNEPSQTIWRLAHGEPVSRYNAHEESLTLMFQRHLNGARMFATGVDASGKEIDWEKIRSDAKKLLTHG